MHIVYQLILIVAQTILLCLATPLPINESSPPQCAKPLNLGDDTTITHTFKLSEASFFRAPSIPAKPLEALFKSELIDVKTGTSVFGEFCEIVGGTYHADHNTPEVGEARIDIEPIKPERPVTWGLLKDFYEQVPHMMNQYYRLGFYYRMVFHVYDRIGKGGEEVYSAYGTISGGSWETKSSGNITVIARRSREDGLECHF